MRTALVTALSIACLASLCFVVVAAGHGVGIVGYILVYGAEHWLPASVPAFAGAAALVLGAIASQRRWGVWVNLAGCGLTLLSWLEFASTSEFHLITLVTSTPYLVAVLALVVHDVKELRRRGDGRERVRGFEVVPPTGKRGGSDY